jgi:hypothetical protein
MRFTKVSQKAKSAFGLIREPDYVAALQMAETFEDSLAT